MAKKCYSEKKDVNLILDCKGIQAYVIPALKWPDF